MDWVVQKASELGVHAILPLIARHGVVRPQPTRVAAQVARWQRIATEAAQQSEQWQPPQISEPVESRHVLSGQAAPVRCCSPNARTVRDWPLFPYRRLQPTRSPYLSDRKGMGRGRTLSGHRGNVHGREPG